METETPIYELVFENGSTGVGRFTDIELARMKRMAQEIGNAIAQINKKS